MPVAWQCSQGTGIFSLMTTSLPGGVLSGPNAAGRVTRGRRADKPLANNNVAAQDRESAVCVLLDLTAINRFEQVNNDWVAVAARALFRPAPTQYGLQ